MTYHLKLNNKHVKFLFDSNEDLNVFNLVRLFRANIDSDEILLDVRAMKAQHQELIASKFTVFLNLYVNLISTSQHSASLTYSKVRQGLIDILSKRYGALQEQETLLFELQTLTPQKENSKDPHFVKNIRGAVLLSLVQDLLDLGKVENQISIFDEKSSLLLHEASAFLNNEENALMMWEVLKTWEVEHERDYKAEINRRIQLNLQVKKRLELLSIELTRKVSAKSSFTTFIEVLQSKIDLPKSIYISTENLQVWFVDDQQANGWYKLIKKIIPDSNVDLRAMNGLEDVKRMLHLCSFEGDVIIPDLALVDLRLSDSDQVVEAYDAEDLSGFKVVDLLLKHWSGLPIMITSASSKLWNMEKAIEKGAVAYWRKSDEVEGCEGKNAVLTAFDINFQFIEKLTLALKRTKYKYVFRVVESLRTKANLPVIKGSSLQRCIENYATELEQKTSWMCWKKTNDIKINDSLYLGVMEIFNEIEPLLWERESNKLVLVPNKNVNFSSDNSDNQVINKTLEYMDSKYGITGLGLISRYETCKSIRNKLPTIHGSEEAKDIKHASLENIEASLLILWCLLNELVQKE